jgi:hypothetical protein
MNGEETRMHTDQELFAKGLATYQKVVNENYMAHKEVYGLLRQVLVTEAPDQFVFLDWTSPVAQLQARLRRSKVPESGATSASIFPDHRLMLPRKRSRT